MWTMLCAGKKNVFFFITAGLMLFLLACTCVAAPQLDAGLSDDAQEQLDASGARDLPDELPGEAQDLLDALDLEDMSIGSLLALEPRDFVRVIWQMMVEKMREPLVTFGAIAGVVVLCALVDTLKSGFDSAGLSAIFSTVSALCVITAVAKPITSCILGAAQALRDCGNFMLAFIPVFTSIVTVSGAPVTATTYNLLLFSACQVISGLANTVLVPFMGVYMGLCIAGSAGEDLGVLPLAKGVRSFVTWSLSLLMTAYVGLLSMQTLVSSGADGAMMKTGKFLVGSFIPIVGGAISDALSAAQGAIHLVKTAVGAFGILAGALIFIPILLKVLLWYLALKTAAFMADVLTLKRLGNLMDACSNCLATMLALLCSFMLLIIVSIMLLLSFSSGG